LTLKIKINFVVQAKTIFFGSTSKPTPLGTNFLSGLPSSINQQKDIFLKSDLIKFPCFSIAIIDSELIKIKLKLSSTK
jgi:hypothetical protein